MRADCTKLCAICQQIVELNLIGSPTEVDLDRCATLESSYCRHTPFQLYNCTNNPGYPVRSQSRFLKAFQYLSEAPNLIKEQGVAFQSTGEDLKEIKSPVGTERP